MSTFGRLFTATVSIGGFVASVWLGMQLERRLSETETEAKRQLAFAEGEATAKARYEAVEGPIKAFAGELSKIFSSSEAKSRLPNTFVTKLNKSLNLASSGDYEDASENLPQIVNLIETPSCIASGQIVEMKIGEFIDHCDSKYEIVMIDRYYAGPTPFAKFAFNGSTKTVYLGGRQVLTDGCFLSLLRLTNPENQKVAAIRFTCKRA